MTPWLPLNQEIDRKETNLSIFRTPQTLHISSRSGGIFVSNSHSKMRFVTFLGQDQKDSARPMSSDLVSDQTELISAIKQNMGCGLGEGFQGPEPVYNTNTQSFT